MIALPIDSVLPEIIAKLDQSPAVVVQAPPGAGKTTRVPSAIWDAKLAENRGILLLEPRRIAARAAARRISFERGTTPGDLIGWHVRFERQANRNTRILAVTPGILLRMLQDDPFLESTGVVIFDEFHERGLEADLAIGLVRLVQMNVRPELKIVVMSATLDAQNAAAYLGDCPIVTCEGRAFPVTIRYEPKGENDRWPSAIANVIANALHDTPGDVLAFLPGLGEIRATANELRENIGDETLILPLHGELPAEDQDRALMPQGRQKVVLATNVAETSVTVEGVTTVIDSGLARQLVFDPSVGLDRLELVPISRASAEQRAGRAGRTQAGMCIRLWNEVSHRSRLPMTVPEIRRVDLAGAVLQLLAMGERPETFAWLDTPNPISVQRSSELLQRLGAVSERRLTDLGRAMARLPVHPRLGRLLIEGARLGATGLAALAAALLAERDPFPRGVATYTTSSDLLDRIESVEGHPSPFGELNRTAVRQILRARDQLERLIRDEPAKPIAGKRFSTEETLGRVLLAAFPDRLCRRRESGSPRGLMVAGRGVKLAPSSGVSEAEFFLALDVDAGQGETIVRLASGIERSWLPVERISSHVDLEFDESAEKLVAWKRHYFDDLILEEKSAQVPNDDSAKRVLLQAASKRLERILPAADSGAGRLLTRLACLRDWMPELGLPAFTAGELGEILEWLVPGCRSFEDLRCRDWERALRSKLTYAQSQTLDREIPERLEVPSGSQIAVQYEQGRPPVLAVRIQELFGLADTPCLAGGRVKVLLHLLAPNYRPQQVTDDLASFWKNTYPVVRKELRARYPKHSWPDDPLTAEARSRPARRK